MRSLSPSRTLTCTRTVSPDFIAGRSVACDFSISSIAPIISSIAELQLRRVAELAKYLLLFFVQNRAGQQIRPLGQRAAERLPLPPPPDFRVVSRQQDVGNPQSSLG